MSILNRTADGLLSVLIALRRALLAYGAQPESALLELVAPSSVVLDGKQELARKTLTRWKQLGFFREAGGLITMDTAVAAIPLDDSDGLRAAILRSVLALENNLTLSEELGEGEEESRASDFTRALAWVLAQDPYTFPAVYQGVEFLQNNQGVQPIPFINSTRWSGFTEWAVFLGVGWAASKVGFVPTPAIAMRFVLDDLFSLAIELPQADFFSRLADLLPVVDGGRYRKVIESQISRQWKSQLPSETSPSLSAALLTLEAAGTLRLETRSDAATRTLLGPGGRELRSISHVIRIGAA